MIKTFDIVINSNGKIDINSNFFQIDSNQYNIDNKCIFFKTDKNDSLRPYMNFVGGVYTFLTSVFDLDFNDYFEIIYIKENVFLSRRITDNDLASVET
jgi:hypothetical protein